MPTSFTSAVPGSAVWRESGHECRATGRAVLSDLVAGLIWERTGALSADDAATAVQAAVDAAGSSGWNSATLLSLAALLVRYGHTAFAAAVRADAARTGNAMSRQTMQAVLWAAYSTGVERRDGAIVGNIHIGDPAAYTFDADASLPIVGTLAPMPLDGVIAGTSCSSATSKPGVAPIQQTGIASINPALLAVLLVATAIAGVAIMSAARRSHGENW